MELLLSSALGQSLAVSLQLEGAGAPSSYRPSHVVTYPGEGPREQRHEGGQTRDTLLPPGLLTAGVAARSLGLEGGRGPGGSSQLLPAGLSVRHGSALDTLGRYGP